MTMRTRFKRLEVQFRRSSPPAEDRWDDVSEEDWLQLFEVRFPDVWAAGDWLMEMLSRVQQGIPPVSTAEFEELAQWFEIHEEQLCQRSSPSYPLDLGGGRTTSVADFRYGLRKGVRTFDAGELAEDLRRLRARYGGGAT